MPTLPQRIVELLHTDPGLTDREITNQLLGRDVGSQAINQTCRRLERQGSLVRRDRGDGRIGNFPGPTEATPTRKERLEAPPRVRPQPSPFPPGDPSRWSTEIPFEQVRIDHAVPHAPGVYRILQSTRYPRYQGTTRILKIGKSEADLCQELLNHFQRHTVANRLARVHSDKAVTVTVDFAVTSPTDAALEEQSLLRCFEDEHWDLPVLNSQRGYQRGSDRQFRCGQD